VHEQLLARGDQAQRQLAKLAPSSASQPSRSPGVGHLTTADAYLAAQAAARAREQRELAREALYDHHNQRRKDQCQTRQDETRAA
jgi:hypothetical protein